MSLLKELKIYCNIIKMTDVIDHTFEIGCELMHQYMRMAIRYMCIGNLNYVKKIFELIEENDDYCSYELFEDFYIMCLYISYIGNGKHNGIFDFICDKIQSDKYKFQIDIYDKIVRMNSYEQFESYAGKIRFDFDIFMNKELYDFLCKTYDNLYKNIDIITILTEMCNANDKINGKKLFSLIGTKDQNINKIKQILKDQEFDVKSSSDMLKFVRRC